MVKKSLVIFSLVLLSINFISAGWFGDLITGKTNYIDSVTEITGGAVDTGGAESFPAGEAGLLVSEEDCKTLGCAVTPDADGKTKWCVCKRAGGSTGMVKIKAVDSGSFEEKSNEISSLEDISQEECKKLGCSVYMKGDTAYCGGCAFGGGEVKIKAVAPGAESIPAIGVGATFQSGAEFYSQCIKNGGKAGVYQQGIYFCKIGKSTYYYLESSKTIVLNVSQGTWTDWLDRDRASGSGDYETIKDFVKEGTEICGSGEEIIAIECQTTLGVDYSETGEAYTCNTDSGGICRNDKQTDGKCENYQVRFFCEEESSLETEESEYSEYVYEKVNEQCIDEGSICTDSDGGINLLEKGASYVEDCSDGQYYYEEHADTCIGSSKVKEVYCVSGPQLEIQGATGDTYESYDYDCPTGTNCIDGACVGNQTTTQEQVQEQTQEQVQEVAQQTQSLCLGSSCKIIKGETLTTTFNGKALEFEVAYFGDHASSAILKVNGNNLNSLQEKQAAIFEGVNLEINEITSTYDDDFVVFTLSSGVCNGCLLNNKCYNLGYRTSSRYCNDDGNFLSQKVDGQSCLNSFECESQICIDECISKGQWEGFLDWFRRIFK